MLGFRVLGLLGMIALLRLWARNGAWLQVVSTSVNVLFGMTAVHTAGFVSVEALDSGCGFAQVTIGSPIGSLHVSRPLSRPELNSENESERNLFQHPSRPGAWWTLSKMATGT